MSDRKQAFQEEKQRKWKFTKKNKVFLGKRAAVPPVSCKED